MNGNFAVTIRKVNGVRVLHIWATTKKLHFKNSNVSIIHKKFTIIQVDKKSINNLTVTVSELTELTIP